MGKKAVLVTGHAGLIGSKLCDWILTNHPEYDVIGIDDLSDGFIDNVDDRVISYWRSVVDPMDHIFQNYDIRYVFHLAARAAESMAGFNRMFFYTNNVVSSANVINNCIKYKVDRLVFASSMSVYGRNKAPFTEDQVPCPVDPYGIGKYAVELDLEAAYRQHGLEYSIFRGHSIYSDKQNMWDRFRNVLSIWTRQALNGEPMTIYGKGHQSRAFTFTDDILPALWMCAVDDRTKNEIYNFGNDNSMMLLDAIKIVSEVTGHRDIVHLPEIYEVQAAYCDHSKVKSELGMDCPTSLYDGYSKMWEWARRQPSRKLNDWDKFEITDGLYEMWK